MSADDQAFLDVLSSVPNEIKRYSSDVADYVDRHLNHVSNVLRETLSSSPWIPESARPRPPPPPPRSFVQKVVSPGTLYQRLHGWVSEHKIVTGVLVIAFGGVTYHLIRRRSSRKKRRARRAGNGARLEVVVIAGSPSEPITRSISLDLERRGFIVYIVCNTIEEEIQVQSESRPDIKPLMIDIVNPESARASVERFKLHLKTPHAAFQGAKNHRLELRSLIIIPSTTYPSQPIATLSPSSLSDLLNTRLLTPILTLQTFLPLLQSLLPNQAETSLHKKKEPSVLVLTPSIISSLSPAFHLPESAIVSALKSFTTVLKAEMQPLNIPVTHIQLGNFDIRAFAPHNKQLTLSGARAETRRWDDSTRSAYARNYVDTNASKSPAFSHGSSLRELNNAIFDSMTSGRGGVVRVGMGSSLYGFVGRWVPSGLVSYMMGMRGVTPSQREFGSGSDSGITSSGDVSPGSGNESHSTGVDGLDRSEYVNVYDYKDEPDIGE